MTVRDDPMVTVDVIVVLYNSLPQVAAEVEAIVDAVVATEHWSLTFVDNGTGADTEWLRLRFGNHCAFKVIKLDNPGFAAGCNRAASEVTGDWLLFLNPDALFSRAARAQVDETLRRVQPRSTLALSMVTAGRVHAGVRFLLGLWFVDAGMDGKLVWGPSGGAGLYPRKLFTALGGFPEDFFAWGEDADLAARLRAAKVPCSIVDVRLPHRGGHSLTNLKAGQARKVRLLYRNRLLVSKRNNSRVGHRVFSTGYFAMTFLLMPKNFHRGALSASWAGLFDAYRMFRSGYGKPK
ncbi:hypothetical protein NOK12_12070 [Nocardioides sp. OK12]|uniref:glycosyltransferase n=1 Tax=Nocardioides sp. OK12 TaxID=2758661 RepID=UPI0021C36730|nr:glycosyltransferase [Nocardioides sp. OK12]GHJ58689.1 hypothetical protein NOK12_12070 [Nocardioides sp. OK12]